MTLIFEIAAGIVLGVATIAIVAVFWKWLSVALIGLIALAAAGAGLAIFYTVCGSWENGALVALLLGAICGAGWLIELFNSHEKYGPSFRAVGNSIVAGTVLATFASLIIWLPLAILSENWIHVPYQYILILPAIVTFALSALVFHRRAYQKGLDAVREQSA